MSETRCPTREPGVDLLQRAVDGELTEREHARLERHCATCVDCARELAELTDLRALLAEAAETERVPPAVRDGGPVERGRRRWSPRVAAMLTLAAVAALAGAAMLATARPRIAPVTSRAPVASGPMAAAGSRAEPRVSVVPHDAGNVRGERRASLVMREAAGDENGSLQPIKLPASQPSVHVFWVYNFSKGSPQ